MKHSILIITAVLMMATSCNNQNTSGQTDLTQPTKEPTAAITTKDDVTLLSQNEKPLIIGLTDMENEMSSQLFIGSYNDSLLAALMPTGASRSAINAFMVKDSTHTVLFDAGLGADKGGRLMESMMKAEVHPLDVDAVCLTHLHTDHIGGLLFDGRAVFPNATLYLSQAEYDAWGDDGPMAANNGLWKQVMEAYKDHIVTFGDGEQLFDGLVVAELAPGHTPGHTVYTVDGSCLIAGDLLHAQDLQLDHPQFCARYDSDLAQATATRIRILNGLRENGLYFAGAHCYEHFIKLEPLQP